MQEAARTINKTRIVLRRGDITREDTDAIVNAANSGLLGGGGVDGAIHRAGGPAILAECKKIREKQGTCPTGSAVITTGGDLRAKFVIHTVGPIWRGGNQNEGATLSDAYRNSLLLAAQSGIKTIAFPSISTGAYGYPVDQAATIAVSTVEQFCRNCTDVSEVRFVLFDDHTFKAYESSLSTTEN